LDGETTIIDAKTLIENFSLDRISRNPAIFDVEKLEWMNGVYIREMSPSQFVDRMVPWLESAGLATPADVAARRDWFERLAPLVTERIKRMDEVAEKVAFLFAMPPIEESAREKVLANDDAGRTLDAGSAALAACEWTAESIEASLRELPAQLELKPKVVFQVIRVAITGSTVSPPLFESLELLGREESRLRLDMAMSRP
jgi:glutamyl-tRNA synthetase